MISNTVTNTFCYFIYILGEEMDLTCTEIDDWEGALNKMYGVVQLSNGWELTNIRSKILMANEEVNLSLKNFENFIRIY